MVRYRVIPGPLPGEQLSDYQSAVLLREARLAERGYLHHIVKVDEL